MRIDVVTIFPEYLEPLRAALLGRAVERGLIEVGVHDLRDWTHDVHQLGGRQPLRRRPRHGHEAPDLGRRPGRACAPRATPTRLVVPTPAGRPFTQAVAHEYADQDRLVFACGRYEGIDQRVIDDARRPDDRWTRCRSATTCWSAARSPCWSWSRPSSRLLPGVLGNPVSAAQDSFSDGLLEGPSYTRPEVWRDLAVPDVLRSGNHARDRALAPRSGADPDVRPQAGPARSAATDGSTGTTARVLDELRDRQP